MAALLEWFARAAEDLPWRRTRDRYRVLVSETMLQATPVARVIPFYDAWIERWPTSDQLARASLGEVLAVWHGLGYPRRARRLQQAAGIVVQDGWPSPDRLTDLPGVGRYTAAALRCFADEEDILPVDTNVRRILARRFPRGWPGAPHGSGWPVGQGLMDLGRRFCTARAPACDRCPVRSGCPAADAGPVEDAPSARRQGPYQGSLRQRRGRLLGRLAECGWASIGGDPEAAKSLVDDGLVRRDGGRVIRMD